MKKRNITNTASVLVILAVLVLFYIFSPAFRGILSDYGFPDIFKKADTTPVHTAFVHIIDVGQGDSILIKEEDVCVLIDTGPNSSEDSLITYLKDANVDKLDCLVLTHPHEDHMGCADRVLREYKVDTVLMPDCTSNAKFFEYFLDAVEDTGAPIVIPERGDKFTLGNLDFTVLAPGSGKYEETNDYSIVLKVEHKNTAFMFTGDAEALSEKEILDHFGADFLKCDLLKAGHHGSTTSNTERFVSAVSPSYAVFSCGYDNSYGHPHREVRGLFDKLGIEYTRTDYDGSVVYVSDGETVTLK